MRYPITKGKTLHAHVIGKLVVKKVEGLGDAEKLRRIQSIATYCLYSVLQTSCCVNILSNIPSIGENTNCYVVFSLKFWKFPHAQARYINFAD